MHTCLSTILQTLMPVQTLERLALIQTAINIVNDAEMVAFVAKYGSTSHILPSAQYGVFFNETERVRNIDENIISPEINSVIQPEHELQLYPYYRWEELFSSKISSFEFSEITKRKLLGITRAVSLEVDRWHTDHSVLRTLDSCLELQSRLIWKSYGKIDRAKTAQSLISNENLDIKVRYALACLYCYDDYVFSLWKKMTSNDQKCISKFSQKNVCLHSWTQKVKGIRTIDLRDYDCENFILGLPMIIQRKERNGIFINLFVRMGEELLELEDIFQCHFQTEQNLCSVILERYPRRILRYLLDWPFQVEFMKVVDKIWSLLFKDDFLGLLEVIIYHRIMMGWDDFNYIELLEQFWSQSPSYYKDCLKEDPIYEAVMLIINSSLRGPLLSKELLKCYEDNCVIFRYQRKQYIVFMEDEGTREYNYLENSSSSDDDEN